MKKTADPTGAKVYSAYDYDKDNAMFNVSGGQNNDTPIYELEETGDERFEITLPLPGNVCSRLDHSVDRQSPGAFF